MKKFNCKGVLPHEEGAWRVLTTVLDRTWKAILLSPYSRCVEGYWLGVYDDEHAMQPKWVWQASLAFRPNLDLIHTWALAEIKKS